VNERFLVTGALGCIGAWSTRLLLEEGAEVVTYDLSSDRSRLELVVGAEQLERVTSVAGDVTDLAQLERALDEHAVTHVIHLAALLVPLVRENPPRGALVNVVGTTNVFEAAKRRRDHVRGLAYASSAAVYGPEDGPVAAEDAPGRPSTHYGVHKQANEGTARVYWEDDGVPSVGLRPYIVYGPGRDQGVTAGPTLAMAAAARGESSRIPFGGSAQLQFAPDAARAFIEAARASSEGGARVGNLGGPVVSMREVAAEIEAAVPGISVEVDEAPLPFPPEYEARVFPAPVTPLAEGVRHTIEHLRARA
jgi:nucleoside-diphosphate-sugar epimerase